MLEDERNGLEPWGLDNMPEAEWRARLREMPRCLPPSRAGSKRLSRAVLIFFDTEFRQQSKQVHGLFQGGRVGWGWGGWGGIV